MDTVDQRCKDEILPEQLRAALEMIPYGAVFLDNKWQILAANKAFAKMLDISTDVLSKMTIDRIMDKTSISLLEERSKNAKDAIGMPFRIQMIDGHGQSIPVELSLRMVTYELSSSNLLFCTAREIRHEVELETSVAASNTRYYSLFNASPVPQFTLSRRGIIIDVNDAAAALLGYSRDGILKRNMSSFLVKSKEDMGEQVLNAALDGSVLRNVEMRLRTASGENVWVSVTSNPVVENEKVTCISFIAINIHQRKVAEERAYAERQRANLYLDIMTHDLNNANQAIMFALGILEETYDLPEAARGLVRDASWNVRRATRLIDNLRTILHIQESPPRQYPLDPYAALVSAIGAVRQDIPWKKLVIDSNLCDGQFKVVAHDYLTKVFFNVIHNCAIYSDSDEVRIDIRASKVPDQHILQITIEDYGPGIPDSLKESIFKRTDNTATQTVGRGLGLTASDIILKSIEGQIYVEDRVKNDYSKGTRFVIRLPLYRQVVQPECEKAACIEFYRSDHCLFCEPVLEILTNKMKELSIPSYLLKVINVDDPMSGITSEQMREVPVLRICDTELIGMVSADQILTALMNLTLKSCYPAEDK